MPRPSAAGSTIRRPRPHLHHTGHRLAHHPPADVGLVADLLPAWEEDWLVLERERIRQIRIHALEALARRLCHGGQLVAALDAAYAAIGAEPLRESAHAALVEIHLAQGNVVDARRQVDLYARRLWAEMGLAPSAALTGRVRASAR